MNPADSSNRVPHRASAGAALAHGAWLLVEKLLRWCVHPRLRARLLGVLGASVGRNVRIYEVQLFNLEKGFSNLAVADDVHIGPGCRLDLAGPLRIGARSTLSPGVTILTHADAGASHGSALCALYPPRVEAVTIGSDCWLGANVTVLAGSALADRVVVAAGSVVIDDIPSNSMAAGVPARVRKTLAIDG
jgi:acetyltransferase-like isoleucine patch superfamily enzyme